ncbi:DUF2057 family protein [Erwinia sorbitola]|uniref:DUF2057 family protein n=1 Tax=Erwinia sorbitola TaxID=2681984 RepID=A0A6I6ESU8_9GAMM|nr:DUF2057 family protein [Erwinia sorbitola]MTD26567.1 DUF2057 family protein [Erwinia sorbitola]QGU88149.1 DUF2057 family protein [Erwinia sorbitola]
MKLRMVITGLIAMLIAATSQATTLKLSTDIDLLVLDGHKISGSLLRGAEGLELERGEHQLLFRVERTVSRNAQDTVNWISVPQIVTFTARTKSVIIQLPALQTLRDGKLFDKKPQITLVDEHGAEVSSKHDTLHPQAQGNLEQAMVQYNLEGHAASVQRFAQPLRRTSQAASVEPDITNHQHPAERMLRLWYLQVDSATRQRFVMLMNALHTS